MKPFPDFKVYCEAACIELWGEPDHRDNKELRWNGGGAAGLRTFDLRKKKWFDFEAQRGGSTLELVAYAEGKPAKPLRGAAFFAAWKSAHERGWVPDPPPPPPSASLPVIQIDDGKLHGVIKQAEKAILEAPKQHLFQRAGMLVRLKRIMQKTPSRASPVRLAR